MQRVPLSVFKFQPSAADFHAMHDLGPEPTHPRAAISQKSRLTYPVNQLVRSWGLTRVPAPVNLLRKGHVDAELWPGIDRSPCTIRDHGSAKSDHIRLQFADLLCDCTCAIAFPRVHMLVSCHHVQIGC